MPHCKAFDSNRSARARVWDLANILPHANIYASWSDVQALAEPFGGRDGWVYYTRKCEAVERSEADPFWLMCSW